MMVSNRNLLFQGCIFRFHVCFGGCILHGCLTGFRKNTSALRVPETPPSSGCLGNTFDINSNLSPPHWCHRYHRYLPRYQHTLRANLITPRMPVIRHQQDFFHIFELRGSWILRPKATQVPLPGSRGTSTQNIPNKVGWQVTWQLIPSNHSFQERTEVCPHHTSVPVREAVAPRFCFPGRSQIR